MRKVLMILLLISFLVGFLTYNPTPVGEASKPPAAYFDIATSVTGVRAIFGEANPNVSVSGFSTIWVMAVGSSASYYPQTGWLKYNTNISPQYFVDYAPNEQFFGEPTDTAIAMGAHGLTIYGDLFFYKDRLYLDTGTYEQSILNQ